MKKVYRYENNEAYWDRRWSDAGSDAGSFEDLSIYPIRYAEMVMRDPTARALEIGCGLGRVVKHYDNIGFRICGIERSRAAVENLHAEAPSLDITEGDVLALPYAHGEFDVVMAFGVYHNLEHGLETALKETARCLRPQGRFAISMRPNNIEMNVNEWYWAWGARHKPAAQKQFHKLLVGEAEFSALLRREGLVTDEILHARNVSIWYRLPFLRHRDDARASEATRRAAGYRLNRVGEMLNRVTTRLFPFQTANVLVFIGHKAVS